jgi:hypothetical protein
MTAIATTTSFDAETAAANAAHHCDHKSGGASFRLTGRSTLNSLYVRAHNSQQLRDLADALHSLANEWDNDGLELNCDSCGVIVPEGQGKYPYSIGGDRVCGDCFRDANFIDANAGATNG